MVKNEKNIKQKLDKITIDRVFKFKDKIFKSVKFFGNFKVQYNIWLVGKIKLNENKKLQKNIGKIDFDFLRSILGIGLNPFEGWWYFAP